MKSLNLAVITFAVLFIGSLANAENFVASPEQKRASAPRIEKIKSDVSLQAKKTIYVLGRSIGMFDGEQTLGYDGPNHHFDCYRLYEGRSLPENLMWKLVEKCAETRGAAEYKAETDHGLRRIESFHNSGKSCPIEGPDSKYCSRVMRMPLIVTKEIRPAGDSLALQSSSNLKTTDLILNEKVQRRFKAIE
ncbi:MAG: hypothetical protein V4692_12025 [Bdellovibrionota bacterium]